MHANHDSPLPREGLLKFQSPNRLSSSGRIVLVSPIHPKCPAAILVAVDKIAERCKQVAPRTFIILRERSSSPLPQGAAAHGCTGPSTNRTGDVPSAEARVYDCGVGPRFLQTTRFDSPNDVLPRRWGATARPPGFSASPAALLCVRKLLGPADLITASAKAPAAWQYWPQSVALRLSRVTLPLTAAPAHTHNKRMRFADRSRRARRSRPIVLRLSR